MKRIISVLKRPQVWGFFVAVAAMALISLAFFFPDNFEGHSLQQPDMVQGAANGHEGQAWEASTGEKALWTNSLFGGMPTFQISPSYPSNRLFEWVNTVYGLWLPSPSNLLFMMMMGFFILMYTLGKKWYYSLIGAVAWGFSSYFIIIIGAGHIWKFLALTYIPPTIAGFILLYRGRYIVGAAITAFFAMMQLSANHPQMSYYFGLLMAIIAICFLIESIRNNELRRWFAASGIALGAGLLALAANAPSLYNTYEYAKETKRAQSELAGYGQSGTSADTETPATRPTGGMPREQILGWSYGRSELFTLVVPNIKGGASAKPQHGENVMMSLSELDAAKAIPQNAPESLILGYLTQYFNDSEGTNGPVYPGVIITALFLLGCFIVRGPLKWAMIAGTAVSCILALGINAEGISDLMIYHFPLYNKFRAVESILVVAEFCMPLLGVLALCTFIEAGAEAWSLYRKPLIISFALPGVIALAAWMAPSAFGKLITDKDHYTEQVLLSQLDYYYSMQGANPQQIDNLLYDVSLSNPQVSETVKKLRSDLVRTDALRSLLFLALVFGFMMWFSLGKIRPAWAVGAVGVLILIDLYGVDKRYIDSDSFGQPVDSAFGIEPDGIDRAILADTASHFRVLDVPGFDSPRRSYFHKMLGGYHAAKLNRYEDIINHAMPSVRNRNFNPALPVTAADSLTLKVISMLNAKYIITDLPGIPLLQNSRAMGNAWLADSVIIVDGAAAEMDALKATDIRHAAILDRSFTSMLPEAPSIVHGDSIYLTYYSPNTLKYRATTANGAIGVFSEVYFPWGWKASIDGEAVPLYRVNYILRAMTIPAGSHDITMTFDPDSISRSGAVAYAAVSVIYLLLLLGIFVQCGRWRVF